VGDAASGAGGFELIMIWAQAGTVLMTILYAWVFYSQAILAVRWVVGFIDSLFPFTVALLQFVAIWLIGQGNTYTWFLLFGIGFAGGTANFLRSIRLSRGDHRNEEVLERVSKNEVAVSMAVVSAVGFLGVLLSGVGLGGDWLYLTMNSILMMTICVALVVWLQTWRRVTADG
jgi:hypothetical protein